jgi:uncharacterized integral membrane protein
MTEPRQPDAVPPSGAYPEPEYDGRAAPAPAVDAPGGVAPAPAPDRPAVPGARPVPRTRFGGLWVAVTLAAVVLLLLLIFILENSQSVDVAYFGQHGHLPLGVALLLAAALGVLLVAIPGYGRIIQLRRAAKHPERAAKHPERPARRLGGRRR